MADEIVSTSGEVAPTPSTPAATPVTVATPALATGSAPQTSATPSTSIEDRSQWVPPHRLRETRDAAIRQANEQSARDIAAIRAESEQYRRQVMALTGVAPPPNPEVTAVREQFKQLYPGLSRLEDKADAFEKLVEQQQQLEAQNGHYWQQYGQSTMNRLFDHAASSIGTPLTDAAKSQLHASFVGFVQSSPELTARYTSDPTIVEDFWKAFTSNFIDPVRRTSAATVVGRANVALPQDTPGGVPSPAAPPRPRSLDERAALGWQQLNMPRS